MSVKKRSCEPKARTVYMCGGGGEGVRGGRVKVGGGWGGEVRGGRVKVTEEVIHLFQTVCGEGEGKGTEKVIRLFQTVLKNLADKYFYFGQFSILTSVV